MKPGTEEEQFVLRPLPSIGIQDQIRKFGTPEQIADLDWLLEAHNKATGNVYDDKTKEYFRKVLQEKKAVPQDVKIQAMDFLANKIAGKNTRPDQITFEIAKSILWSYYKELIYAETGIEKPKVDEVTANFLKNFCKWMIGDHTGEWDIRKSLYIWGNLGVGKSTAVLAGHYLMAYFKASHKWSQRSFKFISMDEIFLETYTTQSLEKIGALAKDSYCLDELRERHLSYKHYGNEFLIISDILTARHNIWKQQGLNTIITSNISPKRLKEVLNDDRLYDRMKQQFITVELTGENKRHPKHRLT